MEWCTDLNLNHRVGHKLRNGLLGKLFLLLPCIHKTTLKSMKKHWLWATASTSRELTAITYNSLMYCNQAKIFNLLLLRKIRWYPGFNRWFLPSPRTKGVKKLRFFFSKYAIVYPMYFNALYRKICIALLCPVFADVVTIIKKIVS